ncbi:MAG TPA: YfhO family protein [Verrucomicrobiae bacterium]|nr:YfhO family protein [Verrucomicrobiae bacterium]
MTDPEANPGRASRLSPDAVAVVILAAALAFYYWGFLLGHHFIWDDALEEFYPGVNYFAKSIRAGRFPLWFPGVRDGSPFYSDIQIAVFYPLQWLLVRFVQNGRLPYLAYQWYIVLHYLLGSLFMYAFLKQVRLGPLAALSGALVFCLSGFSSLRIVQCVMIQVYVWLPLQLLCVHRLTSGAGRWAWLGLVGAMLMSLLAGYPQITLYCWYLVIAYWLYRCWRVRREDGSDWRRATRWVLGNGGPKLAGTFVLVFGLGAVMVLPAAQSWWRTSRPGQTFQQLSDASLPVDQLLTLCVPNFFGKTRSSSPPVPFWGYDPHSLTVTQTPTESSIRGFWQYWEFGAYAGQIFWLALLLIFFNWRNLRDRSTVRFFLGTWLVATWFMLGRFGGLYTVLYHLLPGVALFRGPARMSCIGTFAAAMLVAYGVDLVARRERPVRYWPVVLPAASYAGLILAVSVAGPHLAAGLQDVERLSSSRRETLFVLAVSVLCVLAVVGALWARRPWLAIVCLCGLPVITVADFYHAYGGFQRGRRDPDTYFPETARWLQLLKEYRERHGPSRFGQIHKGEVSEELVAARNLPCFHDYLEVPEGYISFCPDNVATFQGITNEDAKIAIQNIKVRVEVDEHNRSQFGTRTNVLPRAKFYARIRRYGSRAALLSALDRGEIDWHNELAVSDCPALDALRGIGRDPLADAADEIRFTSVRPEQYSISYNVSRPGIVFVSETFYPGWVTTDPRVKLVEVFGAFQGIVIAERGRGQVVVHFAPSVLRWGIAITLLSFAVGAGLVFGGRRRNSRPGWGR